MLWRLRRATRICPIRGPRSFSKTFTQRPATRSQPISRGVRLMSAAKRKAFVSDARPTDTKKKPRVDVLEYHLTPSVTEDDGKVQWPAPSSQITRAREIIRESAKSSKTVLIIPDKDADGLSAGTILRHTLVLLGLPPDQIRVHLLTKGNTVHSDYEREQMAAYDPAYIFVIDQGSRAAPPLVAKPHTGLVIDHHYATPNDFPKDSDYVTACESPPVATSALLTYHLCEPLHPDVSVRCDWLCVVGTHGDLGNTLKWQPPFPDMSLTCKKYTKKVLNEVVSLVNAPRRTATYDVRSAWEALYETSEPASVLKNSRLLAARAEVNAEVERCTHTAPQFSPDGKIAVFRIRSAAQVHPVIATRWSGHLQSRALEIVLVANDGYLPGKVNFSCRIPRCARGRDVPVNIIESLRAYARLSDPQNTGETMNGSARFPQPTPLLERLGDDFARGHVQASGGIVGIEEFEELMRLMEVGAKKSSPAKSKEVDAGQKNNLLMYFKKSDNDST